MASATAAESAIWPSRCSPPKPAYGGGENLVRIGAPRDERIRPGHLPTVRRESWSYAPRMRLRRSLPATIAAFMLPMVLATCSSSSKPASAVSSPATSAAPAASTVPTTTTIAPVACHPAAGYGPGTTTHHLVVAGADRTFLVHMPPRATTGMRLVVDFHGATSDMYQQDIYSGFDPVADKYGFVVATPNGIDAAVRQWRFLGTLDDVHFAEAIVRTLAKDACVNHAHAYAVGISSGAAMSASLACQASDTFAGFGLVSADFYLPPLCDKARRRPIIIFHGTADPVVPYNGGHVGTASGTPVQPAEASAALWAAPQRMRSRAVGDPAQLSGRPAVLEGLRGAGGDVPDRRRRAHLAGRGHRRHPARPHDQADQRNQRRCGSCSPSRTSAVRPHAAMSRSGPTWT